MIVPGFQAAGAAAGIKKQGGLDLALIVAEARPRPRESFTSNRVKAAPVLLSRERLRSGRLQAILVNSGNANACTGPEGMEAARETTRQAAELLALPEALVVPASTGVIGQPLPVARFREALPDLVARLDPEGLTEVARAIMTTDTRPKTTHLTDRVAGRPVTVAGVAKGAGMIHPDMATMLAFVFTDLKIAPKLLRRCLKDAVGRTFNRISIDGDTSTNDTVLVLASGRAGNTLLKEDSHAVEPFRRLLTQVLEDLATQVVADGEGVTRVYRVEVRGAATPGEARRAAATVATSPLVKTAMRGADVNWGRILAALGRSGARFDPARVEVAIGGRQIVRAGQGLGEAAEAQAREAILAGPFTVAIDLHRGDAADHYLTGDLTEDYIRINASYRS